MAMEKKRRIAVVPMLVVIVAVASSAVPCFSLRDPFPGLPDREGGELRAMSCCNECACVDEGWCVCSDRSRFGCFKGCGFCQCYDKPHRSCYCVDILKKCPPPCVLAPQQAPPPPPPPRDFA